MNRVLLEFGKRAAITVRTRWRRIQRSIDRAMHPARPAASGFFDGYPKYYSTSVTGAAPNRLNCRHRALIVANEAIIAGKSVLDLASHDGRWSFAALSVGAERVLGIEAREHLVLNATAAFQEYGIAKDRYEFIQGDVFDEIDKIEPGSIDTVFCFGFFYHTLHHLLLLSKIARLKPKYLIIDTLIELRSVDAIYVRAEDTEGEGNVAMAGAQHTVVGRPTRSALELMLANFGWTARYYDWHRAGIRQWDYLQDYHEGWRISLAVDCGS
jgi:hypothetical protein